MNRRPPLSEAELEVLGRALREVRESKRTFEYYSRGKIRQVHDVILGAHILDDLVAGWLFTDIEPRFMETPKRICSYEQMYELLRQFDGIVAGGVFLEEVPFPGPRKSRPKSGLWVVREVTDAK